MIRKLIKYSVICSIIITTSYFSLFKQYIKANDSKPIEIQIIKKKALDFKLENLSGKTITLSDYKDKAIFLNFWATWCSICRVNMLDIEKLNHYTNNKDFVILAVNIGEPKSIVNKFVKNNNLNFQILIDKNRKVTHKYSKAFDMQGIPTTFILDKNLNIIGKAVGERKWSSNTSINLFKKLGNNNYHKIVDSNNYHKIVDSNNHHKVVDSNNYHKIVDSNNHHKVVDSNNYHKIVDSNNHHKVVDSNNYHKIVDSNNHHKVVDSNNYHKIVDSNNHHKVVDSNNYHKIVDSNNYHKVVDSNNYHKIVDSNNYHKVVDSNNYHKIVDSNNHHKVVDSNNYHKIVDSNNHHKVVDSNNYHKIVDSNNHHKVVDSNNYHKIVDSNNHHKVVDSNNYHKIVDSNNYHKVVDSNNHHKVIDSNNYHKVNRKQYSNTIWNDKMYKKYNYKQFYNYNPANKKINFTNVNYSLMQAAIFYETNLRRVKSNRVPFKYSLYLRKAAQMHAIDMKKMKFFSHYSPIKSRRTPLDRMKLSGYKSKYGRSAENITQIFGRQYISGTMVRSFKDIPNHSYISFAKSALNGWMGSPMHRRNILNRKLKYLGTGAVLYDRSGPVKFFGVQVFSDKGE